MSKQNQIIKEANRVKNKGEPTKKGLEFMAIRFNVIDKRRQLQREKKITPAESCLLQEIELGTIGARNKKRNIGSMAEFNLTELSVNMGYKTLNKIWSLLKSLEAKGLIIRKATDFKRLESIGLNPRVFGQLLIDKEHEKEKRRHLRIVDKWEAYRDNLKYAHTKYKFIPHESSALNTRSGCTQHTNRVRFKLKNPPLDFFRLNLDCFKGEGRKESFTLLQKEKTEAEEAKAKIKNIMENFRSMPR